MRLFALFLLLFTVVVARTQAQDDRVVSFSYNKISSLQYTADWPDYEEDTIFAPNSVNPPLAGPMPHVRFLGKGAGSEIETDAISYGYRQHPGDVNGLSLYFGVSAHADGLPGTAVRTELPADRGADIFLSAQNGTNRQVYDGNGQLMQAGARKLGLMELGSANIDKFTPRFVTIEFPSYHRGEHIPLER